MTMALNIFFLNLSAIKKLKLIFQNSHCSSIVIKIIPHTTHIISSQTVLQVTSLLTTALSRPMEDNQFLKTVLNEEDSN